MIPAEILSQIEASKRDRAEWKQLISELVLEIRALREVLPTFKFDQYGHLLVSKKDE